MGIRFWLLCILCVGASRTLMAEGGLQIISNDGRILGVPRISSPHDPRPEQHDIFDRPDLSSEEHFKSLFALETKVRSKLLEVETNADVKQHDKDRYIALLATLSKKVTDSGMKREEFVNLMDAIKKVPTDGSRLGSRLAPLYLIEAYRTRNVALIESAQELNGAVRSTNFPDPTAPVTLESIQRAREKYAQVTKIISTLPSHWEERSRLISAVVSEQTRFDSFVKSVGSRATKEEVYEVRVR